jgi:hypothetical protein
MAYLREICTLFLSAVTRLIERQMTHIEYDVSHHMTPSADVLQHVAVGRAACSGYLGGEKILGSLPEALREPTAMGIKPVVVAGPEGCGKTALTSLLATAVTRIDPVRKVSKTHCDFYVQLRKASQTLTNLN